MTKDMRRRGLLTFLLNQDADDFTPLVAYSNSTSPEETTALKVTEDAYHNPRFYTIRCTRKRLLLFSIFFLSLLVFSSVLTAAIFNQTLLNTCTTTGCITASEALRRNSESSAAALHRMGISDIADDRPSPCDDFYEYACAGWQENTVQRTASGKEWNSIHETAFRSFDRIEHIFTQIIGDQAINAQLTNSQRDAVTTYKKCMNDNVEDAAQVYAEMYQEMEGWITTATNEKSLEDVLVGSYRMNAISVFALSAIVNPRENTHAVITLEESVPILGSALYYAAPTDFDVDLLLAGKSGNPYLAILLTTGYELAGILGIEATKEFRVGLGHAIFFDAKLARISPLLHGDSPEQMETTLGDLKRMSRGSFKFYDFLRTFMGGPSPLNTKIIVAPGRAYLYRLLELLNEYNSPEGEAIIKDYIKFKQFIMLYIHSGPLTTHKSPEGLEILDLLYNGKTDRNTFCIKRVGMSNQLGFVSLLEKFFGQRLQENMKYAKEIGEAMRKEYIDTLKTSVVVDERDRRAMIEKAEMVRIRLGVPEASRNETALKRESDMMMNDSLPWTIFFPNVMGNIHFNKMSRVHEPLNPEEWPADTNTFNVNVHYNFESNSILFPILMMLDQFIDSTLPSFYSYGGIGVFVGHEMSHGFDFKGRRHGPTGLDQNLTVGQTSRNYEERQKCFQAQYKSLGEMRTEDAVLSENIADNIAIDLAYKAWKKNNDLGKSLLPGSGLKPEKAFFVAYAQNWCALSKATSGTHSVEKLRVLGPLQNSRSFSEVFKCPTGSFMNPSKKCSLW
ncbi:hypothetical protein PENTCL1PPCAC_5462 [Pristionchus entomophagus]|uniref:Peptidase n=1 Tax=Pristionchus entomophagus TaxID=358040 RepID=A0AAV5SKQ4_9BILA|nr:hypothetical protein PENTCL1PPCAC_5462 [Pristionchus entomophagus]